MSPKQKPKPSPKIKPKKEPFRREPSPKRSLPVQPRDPITKPKK